MSMTRDWGLVGEELDHREAIKLAVDRLDWGIDASAAKMVDDHLAGCPSCREVADGIDQDKGLLGKFIWKDDDQSAGMDDDEEDWFESDDADDDLDLDPEGHIEETREYRATDGKGDFTQTHTFSLEDPDKDMDEPELDDDEEPDERDHAGPSPKSSDTNESPKGKSPKADEIVPDEYGAKADEDEDEESSGGPADQMLEDSEAPPEQRKSEVYKPSDEEREAMEAAARALADEMSDQDLAGQDEAEMPDDKVVSSEITEGIDKTAEENGVHVDDKKRGEAERTIRAQDTVRETKFGKVAVATSTRGVANYRGNAEPRYSAPAAAAIRNAVLQSRGGHSAVTRHQSRGRLDNKSVWRIAMNDTKLFRRSTSPSPTPLRVWVMVDVSGSMQGREVCDATEVAMALANASVGAPSMNLTVWAWSDPFIPDQIKYAGAVAGVCKVWETGMPVSEVAKLVRLPMGGTPDAAVLSWAYPEILRQRHGDEQPVIIVASDGQGHWALKDVVADAKAKGVLCRSVALGAYMREQQQLDTYGRGNYIPWQGDIVSTARPLAKMLTKMIQGGR